MRNISGPVGTVPFDSLSRIIAILVMLLAVDDANAPLMYRYFSMIFLPTLSLLPVPSAINPKGTTAAVPPVVAREIVVVNCLISNFGVSAAKRLSLSNFPRRDDLLIDENAERLLALLGALSVTVTERLKADI